MALYSAEEINTIISKMNRPAVILGNGLNEESGYFKGGWNNLLLRFACELDSEIDKEGTGKQELELFAKRILSDLENNSVTLTELYDWILLKFERICIKNKGFNNNKMHSSKDNINTKLISIIKSESNMVSDYSVYDSFLRWCFKKKADILTTNYDSILPSVPGLVCNGKYEYRGVDKKKKSDTKTFPVAHSYLLGDETNLWFINGFIDKTTSLRLSLRDYAQYTKKYGDYIYKSSEKTWIRQFIDRPLIFAGISLDSQETILRTLLIERMRYYIGKKSFPSESFFIKWGGSKGMDDVKREFLKDLGVSVLELQFGEKLSDCFKSISTR